MSYIFEDEIEKKRFETITQDEIIKLRLYAKLVSGKIVNQKLFQKLMIYSLDHDLDMSLFKYLPE